MLRLRRKAAIAALSAVAIGGIAFATPAYANQVGRVSVTSSDYDQSLSWGAGWDTCRASYPTTKSIQRVWNSSSGSLGSPQWTTTWDCYDTP